MPSLRNFQKRDAKDLQKLLYTAYEKQLEVVEAMLSGKKDSFDRKTELEIQTSLRQKMKRLAKYVQ